MRNKQFKKIDIPKWGKYLRGRWRECFASHLSIEEQKEIGMDGFLWHLCSWEKVKCLEKDEAIKAFLHQSKLKCTIFYQLMDEAYLFENANTLSINEWPFKDGHMDEHDMYVMDWSEKWTFVMTHETDYGPYFIQKDDTSDC
ncbi:atp synthase f1 subunit delta [Bacillus pumilus]|uniref:Atp synthase f1 subunit delta n=1 Tax=Bacillus pumilus TaxID=1408 RepID=A0A2A5IWS8_BACPU|nr:DUF4275 family protein [Bacillus pumilus]PCK21760.1 atp synthase f1 subunit delta [Bacillus pumilus]